MSSKLEMVLQTMTSKSDRFLKNLSKDVVKTELKILELRKKLYSSKTLKEFMNNLKIVDGQLFNFHLVNLINQYKECYYRNLSLSIKAFPDYELVFNKMFEKNKVKFCSSVYFYRPTSNLEEYILMAYYDFLTRLPLQKPFVIEYDYDSKNIKKLFSSDFDYSSKKIFINERSPILPSYYDIVSFHKSLETIDLNNVLPIIEKKTVSLKNFKPKYYISNIDETANYTLFLCKDKVFGRRILFFNNIFVKYPSFQDLDYKIIAHPFRQLPSPVNLLDAILVFYNDKKLYGFIQSEEIGFN